MRYVFDLDGTLCQTDHLGYASAEPIPDAIEAVNALWEAGHRIVIDSSRGWGANRDYMDLTRRQLEEWGVKYHALRCGVKIPADRYVDSKAVRPTEL